MQRRLVLSLIVSALLYFPASGISTRHADAMGFDYRPVPRQSPLQQPTTEDAAPAQTPEMESAPQANDRTIGNRTIIVQPHVGVILPLQSTAFGRLAERVRLGIIAASNMEQSGALPLIIYSTTADTPRILEAYERAISNGAQAIIGPLTRNGVTGLAQSEMVSVPTLALNVPETDVVLPEQFYVFGLQIESEARQVAQLAFAQGGRKALIVVGETALGKRISQAFAEEWQSLKGDVADSFTYTTDPAQLTNLRTLLNKTAADVIFISTGAARARFIRPYLGTQFPIYATSLVYASSTDRTELYDLNEVRFLDMPWLLEQDHPAVMTYLRPLMDSNALDEERFYALGIDAYRIVQALLDRPSFFSEIDGVTGTIRLDAHQHFTRALTPARFAFGRAYLFQEEPVESE